MILHEQAAMVREERASVVRSFENMYPIQRAEYDLATAYAAELDDTPIDAEWLRSIGFSPIAGVAGLWGHRDGEACLDQDGSEHWIMSDSDGHCVVSTRGTMLTQLRLMGVRK